MSRSLEVLRESEAASLQHCYTRLFAKSDNQAMETQRGLLIFHLAGESLCGPYVG